MELELLAALLVSVVGIVAGVLLFTPYEPFLEGAIALAIVVAALVGFLMHPRRELYYVHTAVRLFDADRRPILESDLLAVRVELVRLWLLFVPTFLSVTVLVLLAASGPAKFSYLNSVFSSRYSFMVLWFCVYPPLLVFLLLVAWIDERRVMRDAECCSATSFTIYSRARAGLVRRVGYAFMGEHGEYYGGDCLYFELRHAPELATIVFHNVRRPELNKIVMGFLFHRLIVIGRGLTDLDTQTVAAQAALVETTPAS